MSKFVKNKPFNVWIGLRSSDYQMFDWLTPISYIVSIDHDDTKNIPFISIEASTKIRCPWTNEELVKLTKLPAFKKLISILKAKSQKVNIYCYHSLPILEKLTTKHSHIFVHSSSIEIKRKLDNKLIFFRLLKQLKLNVIPSIEVDITKITHNQMVEKLGIPYVVKLPIGASGGQTYMVKNIKDFLKLQKLLGKQITIVSKYIIGYSFNINCFIDYDHIHMTQPSFQLIGIPESSQEKFTYCGNDFGAFLNLDKSIQDQIIKVTKVIGNYMKEIGYYGIFGIDFIYDVKSKSLYALEINPRMQGSTSLLTRYQISIKKPTLINLYNKCFPFEQDPVTASFVLLHNKTGKIKKIQTYYKPGIYRHNFIGKKFVLKYMGNKNIFPKYKNELLILGCPKNGTSVFPGAGILRIEFSQPILDKSFYHLQSKYSNIASSIYNTLWRKK